MADEILAGSGVIEAARKGVGEGGVRRFVAAVVDGGEEMIGVVVAHLAEAVGGASALAIVGAHSPTLRHAVEREYLEKVVGSFDVSSGAGGVGDAEICLDAGRASSGHLIAEHADEIGHRAAAGERAAHHQPLAVLDRGGVGGKVVGSGVHHRESRLIESRPGLGAGGVAGIEERHIGHGAVGGLHTVDKIVGVA